MSDSTKYRASQDCIALVAQIGIKLRNVVPEFMSRVKGDINTSDLPQAKLARGWITTFLEVNARFNGRILTADSSGSKPNPKGRDLRITLPEVHDIAALGQWLISLNATKTALIDGQPIRVVQFVVREEDMIVREKTVA